MLNTSKMSIRECIQIIVMEIPLLYAPTSLPPVPLNLEVKGVPYLANNQWLKVMVVCLAIMAIHYTSKMHTASSSVDPDPQIPMRKKIWHVPSEGRQSFENISPPVGHTLLLLQLHNLGPNLPSYSEIQHSVPHAHLMLS
jgi:hypothetical protein